MSGRKNIGRAGPNRQKQFEALVLPHLDRLFCYACRRVRTDAEAEDLVQETCVRAWAGFEQLRDEGEIRAWLYRILHAVLSDHFRKQSRRHQLVEMKRLEAAHEELIAGDGASPLERLLEKTSSRHVQAALQQIPEEFAAAVELHDIDGFRYREIAEITDSPMGTVMSRIHRGRKLLAGIVAANREAWGLERAAMSSRQHRRSDGDR